MTGKSTDLKIWLFMLRVIILSKNLSKLRTARPDMKWRNGFLPRRVECIMMLILRYAMRMSRLEGRERNKKKCH